jgi:flavin reductase (DIM6/NTAB) family NADH-FMN oxidoreductase RutF
MGSLAERPVRDALRLLSPGPVTLISSMAKSQHNLMTASWLTLASLNPTVISVAIQPSRLTHELISASGQFVINVPVLDHLRVVHEAGMSSGRDGDKFEVLGVEAVDAVVVEPPRVDGCVAYIECQLLDRISAGDHDICVSEVLYVAADDEAFDGHWRFENDSGRILHHLGADRYAALAHEYRYTSLLPDEDQD